MYKRALWLSLMPLLSRIYDCPAITDGESNLSTKSRLKRLASLLGWNDCAFVRHHLGGNSVGLFGCVPGFNALYATGEIGAIK